MCVIRIIRFIGGKQVKVKIKKLHPNAKMPTYATDGSACFDLYAAEACYHGLGEREENTRFKTGLAFEIPENHVMLIYSRSGHGFKERSTLINSVGVIDSDYRGEVSVKMNKSIKAGVGDRIAQAMIIPVESVSFELVDELTNTERGAGGFGSSGFK